MELDDLRRQWRQAAEPPTPPAAELATLLRQPTTSLIDRMRRNAWSELLASIGLALLPLLFIRRPGVLAVYGGTMGLLLGVLGYYYARQLRLLRQMQRADTSLRGHLQVLCAGLRQVLRFYYYLTLWTGPLTLLLVLGYYAGQELLRPAGPRWLGLGVVVGLVLVLGVVFQFGIVYFTRWYLQRLYGQHLDRLEGQLRELDETITA